jgi:hypothetical protein
MTVRITRRSLAGVLATGTCSAGDLSGPATIDRGMRAIEHARLPGGREWREAQAAAARAVTMPPPSVALLVDSDA